MLTKTLISAPQPFSDMPALEHLKKVLQKEFGNDFYKLPNRDTTLFVIVQHGFVTIRPMMDVFLELGVNPDQIFMTTKPHTTPPGMLTYFQENFKHYVPFQWPKIPLSSTDPTYKDLTAATHSQLFENFCYYLLCYPAPAHIKNIIICDEGGKFLNEFIRYYNDSNTQKYEKKLKDYHVVAIEHTKCGTYGEELGRLSFPLINMADSYLKTQIESEFIAKSMFVNLTSILDPIIKSSSTKIGIVGAGNIGRKVIDFLLKKYPDTTLIIYDKEPSVFSASEVAKKDLSNVSRASSEQEIFQQSTVILGCTGINFMEKVSQDCFAENPENHIHLISCSSGNAEFETLLKKMPAYQFKSITDIHDWTMPLSINSNRKLTIYNGGFPINFLVNTPESVPTKEIQITRSMKLASLVQALKLLEVTPYSSNLHNRRPTIVQLDAHYQWEIIQAFYQDLMQDAPSEKQEAIKGKYAAITKKDIQDGSEGDLQPSMSSVLSIPHYITTNYQVKMENQLSRQSSPIKILTIHGTAGSGKTTLAQHYLQKQCIQAPENLSKILLAETIEQWRSSLREWAKELFPELNDVLKSEKDPEKQERIVNQYLQKALLKKKWCIVIDNWDQSNLHVGEIDQLFLNQEGNTGKGTLLITTQGPSPYDTINSLELSHGFLPAESRELLVKVMNLEEELAIDLEALGPETALQELTASLNHLPLAVVLAGSYLKWENQFRRNMGLTLFTYTDYQILLDEKVTKLIKIYDEELGQKGRVPRDKLREEFKRLKTQEAAVDLSLKKAIGTESSNLNKNLLHLLCFCGYLSSDHISQQLLKDYLSQLYTEKTAEEIDNEFRSIIKSAQKYSLFQFESELSPVDNKAGLQLHRVVQHVLRDTYRPLLQKSLSEQQINELITNAFCKNYFTAITNGHFNIIRNYLSHIKNFSNFFSLEDEVFFPLLYGSSAAYHKLGEYLFAEKEYNRTLKETIKRHGEKSLDAAQIKYEQATNLIELGRYNEAIKLYEKVKSIAIANNDNSLIADIQQSYAGVLLYLGRYNEAISLIQETLPITIREHSEKHSFVALAKRNLAAAFTHMEEYEKAIPLCYEALCLDEEKYGANHPYTAITKSIYAMILSYSGKPKQAEPLAREALQIHCREYEKNNIDIAISQKNLAIILNNLERYQEAAALFEQALPAMINSYQENHPKVANIKYNFAITLHHLDDKIKANDLFQQALIITRRYYGDDHIETIKMLKNSPKNDDDTNKSLLLPGLFFLLKTDKKSIFKSQSTNPSSNNYGNTSLNFYYLRSSNTTLFKASSSFLTIKPKIALFVEKKYSPFVRKIMRFIR